MTPQRDLDCSLVSLPLSSRLDAHPGGMWFVSRYKTSPPQKLHYFNKPQRAGKREKDAHVSAAFPLGSLLRTPCSWKWTLLLLNPVCAQAHVPSCSISLMCGHKHSQMHKYLPFVVLLHKGRGRSSVGAHDHHSLQTPICSGTRLQQCPRTPGMYGYRYIYTPCQGVAEVGGRVE